MRIRQIVAALLCAAAMTASAGAAEPAAGTPTVFASPIDGPEGIGLPLGDGTDVLAAPYSIRGARVIR